MKIPTMKPGWQTPVLLWLLAATQALIAAETTTEELLVTANRRPSDSLSVIGNSLHLDARDLRLGSHQHVNELGARVAGTWISRGSGQEHLTAIRSPVLTGPGACGAFLILEDSIPSRPTGFCNVNQVFELPTELAQSVEVLRGPSNALYGSNGLHGSLNVLLPVPGEVPSLAADFELGPDEFQRGRLTWDNSLGNTELSTGLLMDHYDGFQNDSGYDQQKAYLKLNRASAHGEFGFNFSGSNLDQETAGFIRGRDAYRDEQLRVINANPEAYRKADSQRLSMQWSKNSESKQGIDLRLFARRSEMEFLQHFLPGQPLEENGQLSGGFMLNQWRTWRDGSINWGIDGELAHGFLKETQAQDLGPNSRRPSGPHYDYEVDSSLAASYLQLDLPLARQWTLQAGLRAEYLRYKYRNRIADGQLRADGSACLNSCLFFRPSNRSDDFLELAPNLSLGFKGNDKQLLWISLNRGFRAPQATELYRLQSGQSVGDLRPEVMESAEIGWRHRSARWRIEATAFAMRKKHYIFRDAEGFNVADGRSTHHGAEFQGQWQSRDSGLFAGIAATWARHRYDFDRQLAAGESIDSGNDVDTAPKTLGSARIGWDRRAALAELEWIHLGRYYLNAANTARYPGHDLLNLRLVWRLTRDWSLGLRVNNLADRRYADRADFAFGSYRYFPGREREAFLQIAYRRY